MTTSDTPRALFTISTAAKAAIVQLRLDHDAAFPEDRAAVLAVAWGYTYAHDRLQSESVVLTFYPQSMLDKISHGIQRVDGVDLVFFTLPGLAEKFSGKILDFETTKGFFLRSR